MTVIPELRPTADKIEINDFFKSRQVGISFIRQPLYAIWRLIKYKTNHKGMKYGQI